MVLFQYSYTNWAWKPSNEGILIKGDGTVLIYNNPEKWNFPNSEKSLTSSQVEENLSYCTPTNISIPSAELHKYARYIDNLTSSKISAPINRGADMGSSSYFCFHFSKDSASYRTVTIKITGDWECENLNYFSKKTVDWIDNIRSNLK